MRIWKAGVCNERGFTLVELAMVMLVLGIVAAVAMPRVGGMLERQTMRRTINTMRGTVRYLQARAAITKRTYRLMFDLDKQTMSACYLIENDCRTEHNRVLREYTFPGAARLVYVENEAGEKSREGEVVIHFYPSGLTEHRAFRLQGSETEWQQVTINPLTGRLKVE